MRSPAMHGFSMPGRCIQRTDESRSLKLYKQALSVDRCGSSDKLSAAVHTHKDKKKNILVMDPIVKSPHVPVAACWAQPLNGYTLSSRTGVSGKLALASSGHAQRKSM
ncbi:unnamed protein product [Ixodes pacificus]